MMAALSHVEFWHLQYIAYAVDNQILKKTHHI